MKALGLIVEYNPFHEGHAGHLALAKAATGCDTVVAVMSGNFVQRGEPAICDKWRRTEMALRAGVDLVLELPLYYATAGAAYFARGAVALLAHTGLVDALCFGSECGDLPALQACAQALTRLDEPPHKEALRASLKSGLSYPAARAKALQAFFADDADGASENLLAQPNNILGVEYLKALAELGAGITPYTVPRSKRASGTPVAANALRAAIIEGDRTLAAVPASGRDILRAALEAHGPATLDSLSPLLRYVLCSRPPEEICATLDISEGLENRFARFARQHERISDCLAAVKTKRYTYTRLQRAALHLILGVTKAQMAAFEAAGGPQYLRVLGFNRARADLLAALETRATLPLVTRLKNASLPPLGAKMLAIEAQSTGVYGLALAGPGPQEYAMPVVRV